MAHNSTKHGLNAAILRIFRFGCSATTEPSFDHFAGQIEINAPGPYCGPSFEDHDVFATLVTLLVVPAAARLLEDARSWLRRVRPAREPETQAERGEPRTLLGRA